MRSGLIILSLLALSGALAGCDDKMEESANNVEASLEPAAAAVGAGIYCPAVEQRVSAADCEDLTRADSEVRPGAAAFTAPDPMLRGQTFEVHLVVDRRSPKEIRAIEAPAPGQEAEVSPPLTRSAGPGGPGEDPAANTAATGEEGPSQGNLAEATEDPAANAAAAGGEGPSQGNLAEATDDPPPTPGQVVEPLEGKTERFYPKVGRHMRAELVGQGFDIVAKSEASQQIPLGGNATWIWSVTARKGGSQPLTLITVVEGVADGHHFVLASTPTVRTITVEVSLRDRIWDSLTGAPAWIKALTAVIVALGGLFTAWRALPWRRRRETSGKGSSGGEAGGPDGGAA
jgi:hypothetical protein